MSMSVSAITITEEGVIVQMRSKSPDIDQAVCLTDIFRQSLPENFKRDVYTIWEKQGDGSWGFAITVGRVEGESISDEDVAHAAKEAKSIALREFSEKGE